MFGRDFADFVKSSGNYFVLINRAPFRMLPYSIHEIYEIITAGKRTDIRESYHEFKELYSHYPVVKHNKVENIITVSFVKEISRSVKNCSQLSCCKESI